MVFICIMAALSIFGCLFCILNNSPICAVLHFAILASLGTAIAVINRLEEIINKLNRINASIKKTQPQTDENQG